LTPKLHVLTLFQPLRIFCKA